MHGKSKTSLVLFLLLFCHLALLSCLKYSTLHSTYFDLGLYLNNFSNIATGEWWQLFFVHVLPLMLFWSWLYHFLPPDFIPFIILFAQAAVLAWPVGELYRHYGAIPALAFFLYFPLWFNALFDFHMDHLAVGLLFGFFFLERSGRIWTAVFLALLLALVKEPFALQTAFCGLYLLLIKKQKRAGIILILAGVLYFFVAVNYLAVFFSFGIRGEPSWQTFTGMGGSIGEILWFIVTKPFLVIKDILSDSGKIRYLIFIFGALAFIPLLRPGILIVAIPVMAIALLSNVENHSGLFYHYTAGLIAPLTMAFAEGLPTARKIWGRLNFTRALFTPLLLIGLLIIHIIVVPSTLGYIFWAKDSWAYSRQAYIPTHRDKMIKEAIRLHVPSDPKVTVSAQNSLNWGHLAHRKYYFSYPSGVLQPYKVIKEFDRPLTGLWNFMINHEVTGVNTEEIWADYVVLDLKRPWFLMDRGCSWKNEQCINDEQFSSEFIAVVQQTNENFEKVFQKDEFYILKRKTFSGEIP